MTDLPLRTFRSRSKSAIPRNFTNIDLHACLDEARMYKDLVGTHLKESKYQNHVLQSAQRFYKNESAMRPSTSQTLRNGKMGRRSASTSKIQTRNASSSLNKNNPQADIITALNSKALKISQIKFDFGSGIEEKEYLKDRIQNLKKLIVEQKNKKAKISLRNCKLMNSAQISNHQRNTLLEHSRRNNIQINELNNENFELISQINGLNNQNNEIKEQINETQRDVNYYDVTVSKKRRELDTERKYLQVLKQKQSVEYKQMTNVYMVMNQYKEEKAWLLNSVDLDVKRIS